MKIGITISETNNANYPRWIKGDDNDIEIIELSFEDNNINEVIKCDGILLTGGIDICPDEICEYPNAPESFNIKRDNFEKEILRLSLESKKPILGICRGLQLINLYLGGTLHLDLGEKSNEIHKKIIEDKTHEVFVEKNSHFYKIVREDSGITNSAHHQAVAVLGENLRPVAFTNDGTIEAIELVNPNEQFLIAVQWHPERMENQESPFSKNIREAFLNKIIKKI